jgi:hypothetical protein
LLLCFITASLVPGVAKLVPLGPHIFLACILRMNDIGLVLPIRDGR